MKKNFIIQMFLSFVILFLHLSGLPEFDSVEYNWVDNVRIVTTPDSYYYLKFANEVLDGTYATAQNLGPSYKPSQPPLLSSFVAWLSLVTNIDIETLAFFLSPCLSILSVPLIWRLSMMIAPGNCLAAVFSCMALAASSAYFHRSSLGYFDTDALNLVLVWALIGCTYNFSQTSGYVKRNSLILGILAAVLLHLWWTPAGLPLFGCCLLFYSITILYGQNRTEYLIKIIILVVVGTFTAVSLTGYGYLLPAPFFKIANSIYNHIGLVSGNIDTPFFDMGNNIAELSRPSLLGVIRALNGIIPAFIFSIFGLAVLFIKNKYARIFIGLPAVLFTILGVNGYRFLMFLGPVTSLGFGYFFYYIQEVIKNKKWANKFTNFVITFVFILLLVPPVSQCFLFKPEPPFDVNSVILSKAIDEYTPHNASLWNWWGPGYLFQYYGKRKTIIDGGSQDPYRAYITAVPLAAPDPLLSRNWIKFFSVHEDGLHVAKKYTGSYENALHFLINIFCDPGSFQSELHVNKFPSNKNWKEYFFPEKSVYVVLLSDMLTRGAWLAMGRSIPGVTKDYAVPFYGLRSSDCAVDMRKGIIYYKNKQLPFGMIYAVEPNRLSHGVGQDSDFVALLIDYIDRIFYIKREFFDCLTFRLMFINPTETPYFKKIAYNPFVGGIWKVE